MLTIHKFRFDVRDCDRDDSILEIAMPEGATPLRVGKESGLPPGIVTMWAKVDTSQPAKAHRFAVYGTGHIVNPDHSYLSTVQDGGLVWHIFMVHS